MSEELEPLDADALAVLGQLGPIRDLPGGARDRIWRAVDARIALGPLPSSRVDATPRTPPADALPRSGPAGWIARNPWVAVSTALLVGGAAGALGRGAPPAPVVGMERTSPPPSAAPPLAPSAPWVPVIAPSVSVASPVIPAPSSTPAVPRALAASSTVSGSGQQLAAESALLDVARTAIERGESDHALAAVERHGSTFPNGMLREEREALGVKALVLAGRGGEARARAAQFRARYPESLFLPALESALRSIP